MSAPVMSVSERLRRDPLRWSLAGCAAVAALTLLWASSPTYDVWSWIVWSRQLAGGSRVDFASYSPTGWKPLTVLLGIPLVPLGAAAPALWVWIGRTASLMILVFAWRLGRRAAGGPGGLAAVVLCLLSPQSFAVFHGGASEGIATLALLWGIESHLDDRPGRAWLGGLAASLARPEMLGIAVPYGLWQALRRRISPWRLAGGLVAVALLWLVGDFLGDGGRPLALFERSTLSPEPRDVQAFAHPGLRMIWLEQFSVGIPVAVVGAATFLWAAVRREVVALALGATALAIAVPTIIATELGYPAVPRYLLPAALIGAVLAGCGIGRLASLGRSAGMAWAIGLMALGAIIVVQAPRTIDSIRRDVRYYDARVGYERSLPAAISAAGGRSGVLACGRPMIRPGWLETGLAWRLDTQLQYSIWVPGRKLPTARLPSVLFVPAARERGALRELLAPGQAVSPIAASGQWRVIQIRSAGTGPCRDTSGSGIALPGRLP